MSLFVIEPRDAVCLRDGRAATGRHMHTLPFPWPSTIAGLARTRVGSDATGAFTEKNPAALLTSVSVRGPWLVRFHGEASGVASTRYFPSPRDCVWFDAKEGARLRVRLAPLEPPVGSETNLPAGQQLVGPRAELPQSKPARPPAFWSWDELASWLLDPSDELVLAPKATFGLGPLESEQRVHVSIDRQTQTAGDGQLFSTRCLRFRTRGEGGLGDRLGLGFACDAPRLGDRLGTVILGGERRLSNLSAQAEPQSALPDPPAALLGQRRLRVVLLTPAIFRDGHAPRDIAGARVTASVVPRPEVISGWDVRQQRPKPTRRMAPGGSVYWVEFPDGGSTEAWMKRVWLQCVSDSDQDCRDGFGLAAVGLA